MRTLVGIGTGLFVLGLAAFFMAAMATTDETKHVTQPIALGGLALAIIVGAIGAGVMAARNWED